MQIQHLTSCHPVSFRPGPGPSRGPGPGIIEFRDSSSCAAAHPVTHEKDSFFRDSLSSSNLGGYEGSVASKAQRTQRNSKFFSEQKQDGNPHSATDPGKPRVMPSYAVPPGGLLIIDIRLPLDPDGARPPTSGKQRSLRCDAGGAVPHG